jgi:RimJ/RimL family protein N-acetyltransferase
MSQIEPRPILRSERILLRPAEREDIPVFIAWLADADVAEGLGSCAPWSKVAEEGWFDDLQKVQGKSTWHFVICLRAGSRPIGLAGLHSVDHPNGSTELGIAVGERTLWDQGYGTETMGVLLDFAFGELRLHRVYLHVFAGNARAIHVYERLGFRLDGVEREAFYRHGQHHDVHLMSILISEWAAQDRARSWTLDRPSVKLDRSTVQLD